MDNLQWDTRPPNEAGYWWVLFTEVKGIEPKPQMAMVIKYPDQCQMMLIADPKAYGVSTIEQKGILWCGPIEIPEVPLAPGN